MIRRIAPLLISLLVLTLVACPATTPAQPDPDPIAAVSSFDDPKAFLGHLVALAQKGDERGWGKQLAPARVARGGDYIKQHFAAWRPELVKLAPQIATLKVVLVDSAGRQVLSLIGADGTTDRLIRVAMFDGSLKIDEN